MSMNRYERQARRGVLEDCRLARTLMPACMWHAYYTRCMHVACLFHACGTSCMHIAVACMWHACCIRVACMLHARMWCACRMHAAHANVTCMRHSCRMCGCCVDAAWLRWHRWIYLPVIALHLKHACNHPFSGKCDSLYI